MKEKVITQEMLDRIIKKNSAKYLKKLEEKELEMEKYKNMLENSGNVEQAVSDQPTQQEDKPLSEEEVIAMVEQVLSIPEEERSEEETQMLRSMKETYGHAMFNRDMAEAKKWAEENYGGSFEEIIENDDFLEFTNGLSASVPELLKKYVKYTSAQSEKPTKVKTPGSVKDTSGVVAKEYFSKEEVEKMSPEQLKKYISVIENSMKKW